MAGLSAGIGVRKSVLFAYRDLVASGALRRDERQLLAAEKLQSLHDSLVGYEAGGGGWLDRFGLGGKGRDAPMGLYMYGSAGVGKSMLMDMFFGSASLLNKRRVHFHEFMFEVHALLKELRERGDVKDIIVGVAEHIAGGASLLCFDEFHVGNITDAMILGRLFESLLSRGVVIVATSNIMPRDLYMDGLQRDRFLPFIDLLESRFDILHLDGAEDYRLRHLRNLRLYFDLSDVSGRVSYERAFEVLTGRVRGEMIELAVGKRILLVSESVGSVCRFNFVDLCGAALGAQDYMALVGRFRVIFLTGVPIFTDELRNELKRFIILIDVLYESGAVLCMSSAILFSELCCGRDHAFEFQRTYSRLEEMRSASYSEELFSDIGGNIGGPGRI